MAANVTISMELVTPEKAEKWLNSNKNNRKLRPGVAERYAEDMMSNRWTQCPVPISFYENGDLADGQHRLFAISECGIPQRFVVMRGLDRASGLNIDTGATRTLVDNARISGENTELSNELISVSRAIEQGTRQVTRGMSNSVRLEFIGRHQDAARWAISNGPKTRGTRNAITLGAIGRAWYHEKDRDRLKRFCEVLHSGFSEGQHESAAIALRNHLLSSRAGAATHSPALWRDAFLKIQNAIHYFMRQKPLTVIKAVADEAYPLKKKKEPK